MKRTYQKLTVRFPSELLEALRPLAEQENRSLNGEIVQAVYEYLARRQKEDTVMRKPTENRKSF